MKTTKSSKSKNAVQLFSCAAFKFLWWFGRKLIASSMRFFFITFGQYMSANITVSKILA